MQTEQSCVELAAELVPDAEKELAAFARAVKELFGSKQARRSIEDWMEELERMDWPAQGTPDWRCVTIAAAHQLAIRTKQSRLKVIQLPQHETGVCLAASMTEPQDGKICEINTCRSNIERVNAFLV
jgi:hypothetical protein